MKKITTLVVLTLCLQSAFMQAFFVKNLTGHDVLLMILPEQGHAATWVAIAPACLRGFKAHAETEHTNVRLHVCVVSHSNVPFMKPIPLAQQTYSIKEDLTENKVLVIQEQARTVTFTVADIEADERTLGLIVKWLPCHDGNGNSLFSATENHREPANAR